MKTSYIKFTPIVAGLAVISLAFSPVLRAQTSPADTTQNSKVKDSMAGNSSTTPADQPNTLDKHNSKDASGNSLDKNPSTANTGSADTSATKDPTGNTAPTNKSEDKTASSPKEKGTSDRDFILTAAQGGMTEVELGKLAQEKGASADVKQFGSHMVMDHEKANANLKAIAAKDGVNVPSKLDAKHQAMVDKFQHLSGPAFDKAYVHAMVKDHEKTAADFRAESTSAKDPDVKAFATDTLKTVEMHLSDIKSIQSSMK